MVNMNESSMKDEECTCELIKNNCVDCNPYLNANCRIHGFTRKTMKQFIEISKNCKHKSSHRVESHITPSMLIDNILGLRDS